MENHTIVHKPSMIIVGIECRTSNSPDKAPVDIPKLWGRVYNEDVLGRIVDKVSNDVIALYCDYEGDHTKPYSCVIGCQVSQSNEVPEGMCVKVLPASSYIVFNAIGEHPQTLIETWGKIWQTKLDRTYTGDFEVYGDKFSSQPQQVEVLIAVAKK